MPLESHIAHAIAVFSELGIAAASLLLADAAKWRIVAKDSGTDTVARNDLLIQAKKLGKFYYRVNCILLSRPIRFFILYLAPLLAVFTGAYALIGISFYPTASSGLLVFKQENINNVYLSMAVSSFLFSMVAAFFEKSNAMVAESKNAAISANIP